MYEEISFFEIILGGMQAKYLIDLPVRNFSVPATDNKLLMEVSSISRPTVLTQVKREQGHPISLFPY